MATISPAMLAQALLDYFDLHGEEFENFLLDRNDENGTVIWSAGDKCLRLAIRLLGSGDETLSQREYEIRIEDPHKLRKE